jgi:hypothetical protein
MSFTSDLLECQSSVSTTNHALVLGPSHGPSRDPDRAPRNPGPGPIVGAQSHRCRWCSLGPGRAHDRDRKWRIVDRTGCTSLVRPRSSVPSRSALCHQTLAYCSPPFHCVQIYPHAHCKPHPLGRRATIWETGGLVFDVQPSPVRARRQGGATRSLVATAQARQPAVPGEQAHPPGRPSREPARPAQVAPQRSIPHRARSWAQRLVAPFRQILARHSPPSTVSHRPDVSPHPSTRPE